MGLCNFAGLTPGVLTLAVVGRVGQGLELGSKDTHNVVRFSEDVSRLGYTRGAAGILGE